MHNDPGTSANAGNTVALLLCSCLLSVLPTSYSPAFGPMPSLSISFQQWPNLIISKGGPIHLWPTNRLTNPTRVHSPWWICLFFFRQESQVNAPFLNGPFSSGFSRGKTAPPGRNRGNASLRSGKGLSKRGMSVGCLVGCFWAPPPCWKTAPLERPTLGIFSGYF